MSTSKTKKQKSLFRIISIAFLSVAALLILFFSILFILFLVYKDDISKTFLSSVNQKINGKVSFSNISFTPFRHFPNAALVLNDLCLEENKDSLSYPNSRPIFNIKEAYVSVNLIDLFSSKFNISKITFEGGNVNLIVYPDSQTNLQKAIKITEEKNIVVQKKQISVEDTLNQKKETATKTSSDINLNIDDLLIDDLELSLENQFKKNKVLLKINKLQSELSYSENQIICSINLDTKIDSLIKNADLLLSDKQVNFSSKLEVDTDSIYVKLGEGSFSFGEANFLFNGIFDSKNQGYLDLSFSGSDEDFSLFSLFLSDEGIKNLEAGDFFIEGTVKGKTFIEFPTIDISFGLDDVDLINPVTKREIKKLNLKGYFNSGKEDDWSNAKLNIDTLYAQLTDGSLKFKGSLHNLKSPMVDVNLFLSADMTGLDKIFNLGPVKNLKGKIDNLQVRGKFNYGKSEDLSDSKVEIDTLSADLPGGSVRISGFVRNFKLPDIDLNIFLSADVTDLDKHYNLGPFTNLKGKINLIDRLKGKYQTGDKKFVNNINKAKISFEDFGLEIPGAMILDKVNGVIRRENENIFFEDLSIISRDTDFLINGKVNNLIYMLFNIEKDITGDLAIKSSVFDLPNFLFFDPSIKRDFNYRILDVDVSVIAKTTTTKATVFRSFPEIEFDIKKLDATIEDFLPRLEFNSGIFKISESLLGFNLKLEDCKTNFLKGDFNFSAEYNTSKYQPYYIKMKADFNKIYLSELFYSENDTVPESINGKLSGSFFTEFQFPTDSTLLKFIKLKNADIIYEFSEDTITATNLSFEFKDIYFNEKIDPNPLATLYTSGNLKADVIQSSSFKFKDFDFKINITNGSYELKQEVVRLFGEDAVGKSIITLTPFTNIPSYKLNLNDVRFSAEKMLKAFNEDSVIIGPLQLSLNLTSYGSEWDSVVSNMSGTINLSGKNLLLYGMDADEIIDKFKRSQSFNLVDLGAVLLAGPVGIAVTKGTDFARIFVLNSGKSTKIEKLASNWKINEGVFTIEDAAFATNKNRVALTGSIGFSNSNLELIIALLNENGCSIFSQEVYGNLNSPTIGKVKVVGTVLAPVTNLVDDVTGKECEVFYRGMVEHPK